MEVNVSVFVSIPVAIGPAAAAANARFSSALSHRTKITRSSDIANKIALCQCGLKDHSIGSWVSRHLLRGSEGPPLG
jgi:hypothetical protein